MTATSRSSGLAETIGDDCRSTRDLKVSTSHDGDAHDSPNEATSHDEASTRRSNESTRRVFMLVDDLIVDDADHGDATSGLTAAMCHDEATIGGQSAAMRYDEALTSRARVATIQADALIADLIAAMRHADAVADGATEAKRRPVFTVCPMKATPRAIPATTVKEIVVHHGRGVSTCQANAPLYIVGEPFDKRCVAPGAAALMLRSSPATTSATRRTGDGASRPTLDATAAPVEPTAPTVNAAATT